MSENPSELLIELVLERGDPSELDELTRQLRTEAGMFFAFLGETWKPLRMITLAGFLILICSIYFGIDELSGHLPFRS